MPESFTKGQPIAQLQGQELKCPRPAGSSSASTASRARRSATSCRTSPAIADDICIIRSMHTDQINHDPAHTFMNTGTSISGRPSMGSWVTYGLGSESDDLPGFVVHDLRRAGRPQPAADLDPAVAQRVPARPVPGRRVPPERRPGALPPQPARRDRATRQRDVVDAVDELNRLRERVGPRPGDRDADPPVRAGVPDADERPGADGLLGRAGRDASTCTASNGADGIVRRATACWPAGWPSAACGSSSSTTATGTTTATWRST